MAASEEAGEYFEGLADRRSDKIGELIDDRDGWLVAGARLGHLTVDAEIGRGGMGRVYRARDEHLLRDVALKVLPRTLSGDPARRARLKREAQMLASLDHPSIASIHGIEEHDGHWVLVLEMVQGPTLQERLDRGPLPVSEALEVALGVAQALEGAHRAGVVHRDLKPSNIKLPVKGGVKVLDFGIAKAMHPEAEPAGDVSPSPTEVLAATEGFHMMGTIAYMSPEQIRGKAVDPRADVWAFGAVLYQMLSGAQAFRGEDVASTAALILEREPDWSAIPSRTPTQVVDLLRRCLHRDVTRRLQAIGEARIVIEDALAGRLPDDPHTVAPVNHRGRWAWIAGAAAIALAIGFGVGRGGAVGDPGEAPQVHAQIEVEPAQWLYGGHPDDARIGASRPSRQSFAVSRDGSLLVYTATNGSDSRLFARRVDQRRAVAMPGTEGAAGPFLSPDGAWIGFHQGGALRRVASSGGEIATIISEASDLMDAHWSDAGFIVFARPEEGILRVPETGGGAESITDVRVEDGEDRHTHPHVLPGGRAILYTVRRDPRRWDDAQIVFQSLASGERRVVLEGGADPHYLSDGHLVFARAGTLHAVRFDPERGETTGEPIQVLDDVMQSIGGVNDNINNANAQYDISEDGALYYLEGQLLPEPERELLWVDRRGEAERIDLTSRFHLYPRISPDGSQLAYVRVRPDADREIWVRDVAGVATRRLPLDGFNNDPVFSPDGNTLAFASDKGGAVANIYTIPADGAGEATRITSSPRDQFPSSWSTTGVLAFVEGVDLWTIDMNDPDPTPRPFVESPATERWPSFSPDGRWLAYVSDKSGRSEVYVRRFPEGAVEYVISSEGGTRPGWSHDGRELYYRTGRFESSTVMVVSIQAGDALRHGAPMLLFDGDFSGASPVRDYDVGHDGRFVMTRLLEQEPTPVREIQAVLGWSRELARLEANR